MVGRESGLPDKAAVPVKLSNVDYIDPFDAHFTKRHKSDFIASPEYRLMALTSDALLRNFSELV